VRRTEGDHGEQNWVNVQFLNKIGELADVIAKDLAHGMYEMKVDGTTSVESREGNHYGGRERVSFGTNMSTEDECSDSGSVEMRDPRLMIAVERFHARKFKDQSKAQGEKRAVLKVMGAGSNKKQKPLLSQVCRKPLEAWCRMGSEIK
jgi:hypothetical protein